MSETEVYVPRKRLKGLKQRMDILGENIFQLFYGFARL